jgi:hypothetical protein
VGRRRQPRPQAPRKRRCQGRGRGRQRGVREIRMQTLPPLSPFTLPRPPPWSSQRP